ncbi:hypothetical protein IWQ60_009215 [Tieghemiomyces parasiticus]|uniref:6-pyruvoyl tetrahydrobiopterin synthase n=1 Tax=Tieghemiomyces parasiticus TaxID=78921 RepID=A0A9W8DLI2_9FUNG|nr:hypothetical protein IWQ60_009215 [Tieghemiomyces parasiticus]
MPPIAYLSRSVTFSAAHRLHSQQLTPEENVQVYGKCNHPNGHGHNYKVELCVKGEIDPITGMVMNLTELKECIAACITEPLDHKNLDRDVAYFSERPSTIENIAVFIWDSVDQHLGSGWLHRIRLHETDQNYVEYFGPTSLGITR